MPLKTYLKYKLKTILLLALCFNVYTITAQNIFVNELLASNANNIPDEFGEFDDWIEIYNAGATPVDLANYYISDDPAEPTLYQIPATNSTKTTVPAGGYLILWADKDLDQGENHVNIKLGAGGESVVLTAPDGLTEVDNVLFGPQSDDISYGRETDGSANLILFSSPTPNAMNVVSGPATYTVNLTLPITSANDDGEEFSGGGVTLSSSDIEMVQDGGAVFTVAYRFNGVAIPDNAVVTNAYLQFYAEEVQVGPTNIDIAADASPNSNPLTVGNFSSRTLTSNSSNWQPGPWATIDESGPAQQTTDIAAVVQEVVSTAGWNPGNSIVIIMTGSGTRTAYSYDKSAEKAAVLHIEAEVPLPTEPIDQIYINELAAFATAYTDESGKREDWIELYNPNPTDVNIGGLFLTDDYGNLDKWQIGGSVIVPAGGFTTFFADEDLMEGVLHADFKLKAGGEELALVQLLADGLTIIDSISYDETPFLTSYGRTTDGASTWQLFGESTPDASNSGGLGYLTEPIFSLASGLYSGSQTIELSHPDPDVDIYYTLDADLPDDGETLYTGPITINSTKSIRAIAIRSGFASSQVVDNAYLIDENPNMPVLYLTTDPDNFFDDEIGIYVDGTNGVVGFCSSEPVNWAQDWQRPCNLKLFLPDGEIAFDVNAEVEISGACSRNLALKSLAVNLKEKEYGDDELGYEIFPQRDYDKHQRFKIRNSGQDFYRLGFRDLLNQTLLFKDIDIEIQAGRAVIVYLNGEFWGLQNIREKFAGEHFEELYDVKEKDLDIIKSPGLSYSDVKKGSEDQYLALFDFVENGDLTNQADYDYFDTQVDVNEFLNYWSVMTYMANYDWPANNLTIWRDRTNQTKWRYGVADTDGSTNNFLSANAKPEFNTFEFINDPNSTSWPNNSESTLFLRKLLERDDFRHEFIQRTCTFIEVLFPEERTHPLIDSLAGLFQPNLAAHLDNWAFDNAMGSDEFSWNEWIDKYKTFWEDRPGYMRDHINDFYDLDGYYDLTINFNEATEGDVFVNLNNMEIPFNYTGTYFKDIPLRLTAVADPGFQFAYWLETGVTDASIDYVGTEDFTLTPIFVPDGPILSFNCPDDISITIASPATTTAVSWPEPVGSTTCAGGVVTATQTSGPLNGGAFAAGSTTVNYFAEDECNNFELCSFEVTVIIDNGNLSLTCPSNLSVAATPGSTSAIVNWTEPTVSTTCVNGDASFTQTSGPVNGTAFPIGTTTITYEATDGCGNVETCSFVVTVTVDNGTLSLTCPNDITLTVAPGSTSAFVTWTEPVATTTCGGALPTITQTAGPANGGSFNLGQTTVAYEATDNCGNIETCFFVVTVISENSILTLDCPVNISVTAAGGTVVDWLAPNGISNCSIGAVTTNQIAGDPSGSFFPEGNYTISYEAFDECGAMETCSFTITVSGAPGTLDLTCPANQVLVLPQGATSMAVNWPLPTVSTTCGGGVQNENCGTTPTGFSSIGSLGDSEYFLSLNKIPWTLAQANCETFGGHLVTIGDEAEDDFIGDNITTVVHIGLNDVATENTYEWINGEAVAYTNFSSNSDNSATNDYVYKAPWSSQRWGFHSNLVYKYYIMELDCGGGSSIDLTQTSGPTNGAVLSVGTYTISYQAEDDCGDIEVCSFTIEIQDNPQTIDLACPSNITVTENPAIGGAIVNWNDPVGSTTCSTGGYSLMQTGGMPSGTLFPVGTYIIAYQATDNCGMPTTCEFVITVQADTPSEAYCEAAGVSPWQQHISNVSFNTLNHDSGKEGYADFTDENTAVTSGSSYTISVTPKFSYTHWDEYIRVWIDYNGDFDFTDAGELAFEDVYTNGQNGSIADPVVGTITIPTGTISGATRMRVAMKKEAYADPCETFDFGEVEDYTVILSNDFAFQNSSNNAGEENIAMQDDEASSTAFSIYPNPAQKGVYIDLSDFTGNEASLEIYNAQGQQLVKYAFESLSQESIYVNLSTYSNGVYTIKVNVAGAQQMTKRLIVSRVE